MLFFVCFLVVRILIHFVGVDCNCSEGDSNQKESHFYL